MRVDDLVDRWQTALREILPPSMPDEIPIAGTTDSLTMLDILSAYFRSRGIEVSKAHISTGYYRWSGPKGITLTTDERLWPEVRFSAPGTYDRVYHTRIKELYDDYLASEKAEQYNG